MLWTLFNPDVSEEFDFYDQTVSSLQQDLFLLEKMLKMQKKKKIHFLPAFGILLLYWNWYLERDVIVSKHQMQLSWLGFEFS